MEYWFIFFSLAGVIFFSGKNLIKYGDILSEKLNIGKTILGVVFIASITSLPELITGISASAYVGAPDLVGGDVLGSCMANLLILAVLDAYVKDQPLTTKVHHGFTISSAFGIILISVASSGILLKEVLPEIGWVSVVSFVIIIIYIFAVKITASYEKRLIKEVSKEIKYRDISTKEAFFKYMFNAFIIVIAATFLPKVGHILADMYGISETFFGSLFIAVSTSLPELAVSIAGVKLNLIQVAVANLLGSNIFNIFILAVSDFFYTKTSIFRDMSLKNTIPAVFSVLMTSIVIIGLVYKAQRKEFPLGIESIFLIISYLVGLYFIFIS